MTSDIHSIKNLTAPLKSPTPKTLVCKVSKTHYSCLKEKLKRQSPPKVVGTPLIFLPNNYIFSFPSLLFPIQPPFPPQNNVVCKRNLMRPHQTLAECYWASFCYRKQHCKGGGGAKCRKL